MKDKYLLELIKKETEKVLSEQFFDDGDDSREIGAEEDFEGLYGGSQYVNTMKDNMVKSLSYMLERMRFAPFLCFHSNKKKRRTKLERRLIFRHPGNGKLPKGYPGPGMTLLMGDQAESFLKLLGAANVEERKNSEDFQKFKEIIEDIIDKLTTDKLDDNTFKIVLRPYNQQPYLFAEFKTDKMSFCEYMYKFNRSRSIRKIDKDMRNMYAAVKGGKGSMKDFRQAIHRYTIEGLIEPDLVKLSQFIQSVRTRRPAEAAAAAKAAKSKPVANPDAAPAAKATQPKSPKYDDAQIKYITDVNTRFSEPANTEIVTSLINLEVEKYKKADPANKKASKETLFEILVELGYADPIKGESSTKEAISQIDKYILKEQGPGSTPDAPTVVMPPVNVEKLRRDAQKFDYSDLKLAKAIVRYKASLNKLQDNDLDDNDYKALVKAYKTKKAADNAPRLTPDDAKNTPGLSVSKNEIDNWKLAPETFNTELDRILKLDEVKPADAQWIRVAMKGLEGFDVDNVLKLIDKKNLKPALVTAIKKAYAKRSNELNQTAAASTGASQGQEFKIPSYIADLNPKKNQKAFAEKKQTQKTYLDNKEYQRLPNWPKTFPALSAWVTQSASRLGIINLNESRIQKYIREQTEASIPYDFKTIVLIHKIQVKTKIPLCKKDKSNKSNCADGVYGPGTHGKLLKALENLPPAAPAAEAPAAEAPAAEAPAAASATAEAPVSAAKLGEQTKLLNAWASHWGKADVTPAETAAKAAFGASLAKYQSKNVKDMMKASELAGDGKSVFYISDVEKAMKLAPGAPLPKKGFTFQK